MSHAMALFGVASYCLEGDYIGWEVGLGPLDRRPGIREPCRFEQGGGHLERCPPPPLPSPALKQGISTAVTMHLLGSRRLLGHLPRRSLPKPTA